MYIEGQENEYRSFLVQNEAFWRENTGRAIDTGGRIYVDLSHDHSAYLATNLWIAKYIQLVRGGRLVGLAHGWLKACPQYNFARVREFARSFLVDEVIDLDDKITGDLDVTARFEAAVRGVSGRQLRQAILNFDADKDPDIGWILYDTWLRQERRGTIESAGPDLLDCARTVFRIRRSVSITMQDGKTAGVVVGHYHYSPYAFMAFEAARQSAPVYFQSLLIPVSIRRFTTVDDIRRGRPADFLNAYEQIVSRTSSEQRASFEKRMFEIQRGAREFFRVVPGGPREGTHDQILNTYGLDPSLPVACLFVPALCGAPHCFGPIPFDDFGDWVRSSLEAARGIPGVNFLVKRHPQDATYDTANLVEQLESLYGAAPNIRFLSDDVPAGTIADLCDAVVTVSGTPGYEMAARGIPTIAAGPSRYSGLGIAREPADRQQYEALLRATGDYRLSADQQRRAVMFAFFELALSRSISLFITPVRTVGTAEFWQDAERNLRSRFVEEDPLYRNVRYMLDENLPFLLNTDLVCPTMRAL